jgi:hypothetical protein
VSGRIAKRLRSYLLELPGGRTRSALTRLGRGWRALPGRARGRLARRPDNHAADLFAVAPAYHASEGKGGGKKGGAGMLLRGRPRVGGPRKHPGRAWLRTRRERLAAERGGRL